MVDSWEQIKGWLAVKLSQGAYQNWISQTTLASLHDGELTIRVPNEATETWIRQEYASLLRSAVQELRLPVRHIHYEITSVFKAAAAGSSTSFHAATATSSNHHANAAEPLFENTAAWLNPRLTFDTYVVGSSNQLAHAAAQAVAKMPSRSYNPLFIYGGVGIGKTHLMHAIGRSLLDNYGGLNVVYTSSERFMNEMISSIKLDRMSLFHRHYRSADVLLIDDIHIIAGKERTQEEFFHTFNELYDHCKQIVISSDSVPNQLSGLVERLRSRFEWGLMVDVQPPDLETKMAILDKRAEAEGVALPQDVRIFIATKTKSNVRELEGALTRLIAISSVTGQPITLPMAQQTLKHLNGHPDRRISVESILRAVGERFSLQPAQLKMKSNTRQIAYPRQIAMYLVKELTHASLPEIGRYFGGKHHTTVLHSVHKIEELRQRDDDLNSLIQRLIGSLQ
ncbi:MAG: chromosomal replication initiator protein DnaA [Acidobacteriota bacterium]|nr:chromosomal replication initiator protein DnaA [Acidobacteriota bacterium]MDQ2843500.1 chromosomal replication initiator protein DnaA [Acidobacteriota bacterium]